jgi:2,3-dimethylmalate lyase
MLANMVEGGRTPVLSADELTRIGYRIAIFPAIGFLSAAHAMQRGYAELKAHSSSDALKTPLLDFQAMSRLMGFDEVSAFDARWNPPQQ